MSYRRRILSRLKEYREQVGPPAFLTIEPADVLAAPGDQKFTLALNRLLLDRVILGETIDEYHRPVFCLNPDKMDEIDSELQWYRDPELQFRVGVLIVICGLTWAIISWQLKP
jgi:hypothetical protein